MTAALPVCAGDLTPKPSSKLCSMAPLLRASFETEGFASWRLLLLLLRDTLLERPLIGAVALNAMPPALLS